MNSKCEFIARKDGEVFRGTTEEVGEYIGAHPKTIYSCWYYNKVRGWQLNKINKFYGIFKADGYFYRDGKKMIHYHLISRSRNLTEAALEIGISKDRIKNYLDVNKWCKPYTRIKTCEEEEKNGYQED